MKKLPAQPNQSLIDGLTILQALAAAEKPVSCAQLARELDLDTTRVNRLLKTLDYLGLAHRTASSKYSVGSAMHVLAAQSMFGSGLVSCAGPIIEALTHHGYMVALGVLWKDMVSYLYHWYPGVSITEAVGRVSLYPATRSSIGLALLAQHTDAELELLYTNKAIPGFPDYPALLESIAHIRTTENAVIPADSNPALKNIAVPVGLPAYAAIAMVGIDESEVSQYITELQRAATDIAAAYEQRIKG